jgi:hypothetical protein
MERATPESTKVLLIVVDYMNNEETSYILNVDDKDFNMLKNINRKEPGVLENYRRFGLNPVLLWNHLTIMHYLGVNYYASPDQFYAYRNYSVENDPALQVLFDGRDPIIRWNNYKKWDKEEFITEGTDCEDVEHFFIVRMPYD